MIWSDGRVMPDDALRVSVLDRTFEHGLGLFETLRTWDGRAPLLGRHLDRLTRSARELKLPIDSVTLPTAADVRALCAEVGEGDVVLRMTLTGGVSPERGATLWVRASPLPAPLREGGAAVEVAPNRDGISNALARYKTLNYWRYRLEYEGTVARGYDEILMADEWDADVRLFEGSRTNLFWVRDGILGAVAAASGLILPGVLRGLVLELARGSGLKVKELTWATGREIASGTEVFLTNSVRGIIPVGQLIYDPILVRKPVSFEAPGPVTRRLTEALADWVQAGGDSW